MEKVDLQPGDICPCCGQMIRRKSEAQKTASRENGKKGGRPKGSKNKPKT